MDTLDALENESVRSLNLNQLERNSVLKTPRNASEYTSLLNVVADVGELDPVCGEVTPNQILHWKQTPSDTYVPFGWPRKSYWKEMIEVYRSLQRDKGVKGHFRDSRWLTPFRDGSAAETETFFLPSHPWVTTTPLLLSESSSKNEYVILHCECVPKRSIQQLVQMRHSLAKGEGNQHGVHWSRPRVVHVPRLFNGR